MATEPIATMSGGEKARLVLAMIVRARPQLLILDEPTNHLDIEMREALAEALQAFDGTLIVVAHDRHLLAATTDQLLLVDQGSLAPFDGDLDDYRDWVLTRARRSASGDATPSPDRKAQKRSEAEARQKRYAQRQPLAQKLATIESAMDALLARKREVDEWLASEDAYSDANRERMKAALAEQGEFTWQLARLETEWLEVADALQAMDAS